MGDIVLHQKHPACGKIKCQICHDQILAGEPITLIETETPNERAVIHDKCNDNRNVSS